MLGAVALLLAACQDTPPPVTASPAAASLGQISASGREESHRLPIPGTDIAITMRLCRPDVTGEVPLAVINHGSPASASQRPSMTPASCTTEAVRWFTERGFAVALPLRRGYGATGGTWAEEYGSCGGADFARAGRETARDIAAAITNATTLPNIRPQGVVVVGQSAGGWGTLALASQNPPAVAVLINFAGGRGGWSEGRANTNCRPDRLVSGAGEYGRTARQPSLWLYTANDTFFAPAIATDMHRAYAAAGGSVEFNALGAYGQDGHSLFFGRGGSAIWGSLVETFLRGHGFAGRRG